MSSVLAKHNLVPHPDCGPPDIEVTARLSRYSQTVLQIDFTVSGQLSQIVIPEEGVQQRADKLWESTCFEAFVEIGGGPGYIELNISPSRHWALYRFGGYRTRNNVVLHPSGLNIFIERENNNRLMVSVMCDIDPIAALKPTRLGLSAVVEANDGTLSYWALKHSSGRPDFHKSDCFALNLPPID